MEGLFSLREKRLQLGLFIPASDSVYVCAPSPQQQLVCRLPYSPSLPPTMIDTQAFLEGTCPGNNGDQARQMFTVQRVFTV